MKQNQSGISIVEVLIAIAIFGLAFMAFSNGIWSASRTVRITSFADESIMAGQDVVEMLSAMDINEVKAVTPDSPLTKGNQKIIFDVVDSSDLDGDGVPDFKTIAVSVYCSDDNTLTQDKLRLKNYYRRRAN